MKGKILLGIILLVIAISAYQFVIHPAAALEKAKSEIIPKLDTAESTVSKVSPAEINSYSEDFEKLLDTCKPENVPLRKYVQVYNPESKGLARSLTKNDKTDESKVTGLFTYVSNEVKYRRYENWRTTSEVLQTKDGDCTDKSILLVSMLKSIGIESYIVYGEEKDDYSHAWVAAKVNKKWLLLDPTAGDINYVYTCLADENCEYNKYYMPIVGIFDENGVLKCEN